MLGFSFSFPRRFALPRFSAVCLLSALTVGSLALPAAAAVTFAFDNGSNGANGKYNQNAGNMFSVTVDGITLDIFAGLYAVNNDTLSITQDCSGTACGRDKRVLRKTDKGLGIGGHGEADGHNDIDGDGGDDLMSFVFDTAVVLESVTFRKTENGDRADLIVDGALVMDEVAIRGMQGGNSGGAGTLGAFSFGAFLGETFGFGADDDADNFRIARITVSRPSTDTTAHAPVPLPAAGLLMLGAIGGLGLAARRRRRAG